MFKKNSIFSSLSEDKTLDSIKGIKRINFTPEFLIFDFKIDDFKNSLVIFDDIDSATNKILKAKIYSLLDMILTTGRHTKKSCIYTSHLCNKGNETKLI